MTTVQQNPAQARNVSPAASFNQFLQKHKGQLTAALPKHMNADRMVRLALTVFSQNKDLAKCDQNSVFASLIIAGQLGLEPGVNGQCYLIPYAGKCTFVPGWKGLVDLVSRSGRASVWTGAVFEGDEFDYMLGDAPYCRHKPTGDFDLEKLTHVYAIGRIKDSVVPVIEVWPIKKVDAHLKKWNKVGAKHYALANEKKNFEMYARKVALLQVLKYMPQSIELATAMDVEAANEQGRQVVVEGDFVVVDQGLVDETESGTDVQTNAQQPEFMDPKSITAIEAEFNKADSQKSLDLLYNTRVMPFMAKISKPDRKRLEDAHDKNTDRLAQSNEEEQVQSTKTEQKESQQSTASDDMFHAE